MDVANGSGFVKSNPIPRNFLYISFFSKAFVSTNAPLDTLIKPILFYTQLKKL